MNEQVMQSVWRRLPKPSSETITRIFREHKQRVELAHMRLLAAILK